ncbi:MAG: hypothetical protein SPH96_08030 [Agathobacter sp.]|nr:hypothetical protein [Agathobacter sp.]
MKYKLKKGISGFLAIMLVVGILISPTDVKAAEKPYGDSLKLNNEIKLNKTSTYEKTGIYYESTFFKKKKKSKVKYTIKCTQKDIGNKYKATYQVKYKFLKDVKIDRKKNEYDDWAWGFTSPHAFYTVFDYQTGLELTEKNKLGVKVKDGKTKITYYPKQYYVYNEKGEKTWIRNTKTISTSFTVTYPKNCKDVVVGIGFSNREYQEFDYYDDYEDEYFEGKIPYGESIHYQKGKKTASYMRLNYK